ncbi:long-chain-fatty-acid--CoA ligase ACSBG2 isoform X2 [Lepeophtheirus salmonis]|nr:long-chain-fatty-acid--CoA ligase ACSBG2-like isoform X2 [Lepeophtheirus salmonis]
MKPKISLVPSDRFVVSSIDDAVKLRTGSEVPSNYDPISIPQLLEETASEAGYIPALRVRRNGDLITWTFRDYLKDVRTAAKAMLKCGLEEGNGVCILGFNSPEWFIADLGAIYAGGIPSGIYPTNNPDSCKYIASHCHCTIMFVENQEQLQKIQSIKTQLPHLRKIIQYIGEPTDPDVLSWNAFISLGTEPELEQLLEISLSKIAANKCCHLVYTSGTTGNPKGVMLSHDNITFTAKNTGEHYKLKEKEERFVSYLPLSHIAAVIVDIFIPITFKVTVYFADKNALKGTLTETLRECHPTLFFGVPRVYEKMQEKIMGASKSTKGLKKHIGRWAKKTGYRYNKSLITHPNQDKDIQYKVANKVVFQKVKALLGFDKCVHFVSSGAPLSIETLEYFMSLDILIMELYGMSECCGPHTANTLRAWKPGKVGRDLPGFLTKIDKDGEIHMKGRNIFMGYLNDSISTDDAFTDDGFLKSGDLGELDSSGFLRVTGRRKELIITAGGENIPPVLIEDKLKASLSILSNAMVIGDNKKYLSCFLTLKVNEDPETHEPSDRLSPLSEEWCNKLGSHVRTVSEILENPEEQVLAAIQEGINKYNINATSNAQKIQKWIIIPKDFSVSTGELGPTLKMKRYLILKKYEALVKKMYS